MEECRDRDSIRDSGVEKADSKVVVDGRARQLPTCELLALGSEYLRVVTVDGRCLYAFGRTNVTDPEDYQDDLRLNRIFKFDFAAGGWSEIAKGWPCYGEILCLSTWPDKSAIYFAAEDPNGYNTVWRFDCKHETMSKVMTFDDQPMAAGEFAIVGKKLFVIGSKSIFEMDLDRTAEHWEQVGTFPGGAQVNSASWINGSVYVYVIQHPRRVLIYDYVTRGLSELKPLEGGDFLPGARIFFDGDLMMSLASRDGQKEARLVVFDPSNEESGWLWVEAASLPPHLSTDGIAFENGLVYVIGRCHDDQRSGELWEIKLTRSLCQEGPDLTDQAGDVNALPSSQPWAQELCQGAPDSNGATGDANIATGPLEDFARLLSSGEFADVRFLVGAERQAVKGHVAIVASRCPVLAMLIKETKMKKGEETKASTQMDHNVQCCRLEVELPEVDVSAFNQVLQYIYTGHVDRGQGSDVRSGLLLYDAAAFLHMEGLQQECADNLRRSAKVEDFIERLQRASTLSLVFAQQFYVNEIVKHKRYMEIAGSRKFCRLGPRLTHEVVLQYGRLHGEGTLDDAEPAECMEEPE